MNIPSNLTKEHFLKAFDKIDQEGIPANGHSSIMMWNTREIIILLNL